MRFMPSFTGLLSKALGPDDDSPPSGYTQVMVIRNALVRRLRCLRLLLARSSPHQQRRAPGIGKGFREVFREAFRKAFRKDIREYIQIYI